MEEHSSLAQNSIKSYSAYASRMQDIAEWNKKVFRCFLNDMVSRVDLMSTGSLFQAFSAVTENAPLMSIALSIAGYM